MRQKARNLSVWLMLPVLLCCESGDKNDSETADPLSGVWNYENEGIDENTCGTNDVYTDPDLLFRLTNNGDQTFTVDQNAEEDFECAIEGEKFDCPSRLYDELEVPDTSVTLSYKISLEGSFSSNRKMSGTQRMSIQCQGAACAFAPALGYTLPCYYTVDFTATHR